MEIFDLKGWRYLANTNLLQSEEEIHCIQHRMIPYWHLETMILVVLLLGRSTFSNKHEFRILQINSRLPGGLSEGYKMIDYGIDAQTERVLGGGAELGKRKKGAGEQLSGRLANER